MDKDFLGNDKELDEFGFEVRKSFDEEFNSKEISVSEDLIARTMAAIKLQGDQNKKEKTSDEIVNRATRTMEKEAEITNINSASRKRSLKWVTGIAAALIIGVVGLVVFKLGGAGLKNESASAPKYANTANESAAADSAPSSSSSNLYDNSIEMDSPRGETSASQAFIDADAAYPVTESEFGGNSTNYFSVSPSSEDLQEDLSVSKEDQSDYVNRTPDELSGDENNKEEKSEDDTLDTGETTDSGSLDDEGELVDPDMLKSSVTMIAKQAGLKNDDGTAGVSVDLDMAKYVAAIRNTEEYVSLMDSGNAIEEALKELLKVSEDGIEKFIISTALEDLDQ